MVYQHACIRYQRIYLHSVQISRRNGISVSLVILRCAVEYLGKGEARGMVQVYTPGRHIPFLKKHGGNVVEVVGAFHWYQICLSLSTFYFL